MDAHEREPPPPYFGDPHGMHWSAVRSGERDAEPEDYSVTGPDLWLEGDEFVGPLRTPEDGPLPDEPEWLKRALGLSDSLIADLLEWQYDMGLPRRPQPAALLDERGEQLARRLQVEVGDRFTVRYQR